MQIFQSSSSNKTTSICCPSGYALLQLGWAVFIISPKPLRVESTVFFLLSGRDFSSILPVVMSFSRAVSTENEGWKHLRDTPWTTFTSQPSQTKHLCNTKFSHLLTSENHSPLSHLWNKQITRRLTELSCWSWGLGPAVLFWVYFNKPELLWGRDKGMVLDGFGRGDGRKLAKADMIVYFVLSHLATHPLSTLFCNCFFSQTGN